jgi:hypothetical protein
MKSTEIRANFITPRNEWQLFRAMVGKYKAFNPDGKERTATAADVLRELIHDWMFEHKDILKQMTEDLKKYALDGEGEKI